MTVREWLFTFKWHDPKFKMYEPADNRPYRVPLSASDAYGVIVGIVAFVIAVTIVIVCALAVLRVAGLG